MKLKAVLLVSILFMGINYVSAEQLSPTDCTSEKYLRDHGHSSEIIRIINVQKTRTEEKQGEISVSPSPNKLVKFWKNLWTEQDATLPLNDFGYNNIKTVETQKVPYEDNLKNLTIKKNKTPKNSEIMINEIR